MNKIGKLLLIILFYIVNLTILVFYLDIDIKNAELDKNNLIYALIGSILGFYIATIEYFIKNNFFLDFLTTKLIF